jgi:Zn-dependent protease
MYSIIEQLGPGTAVTLLLLALLGLRAKVTPRTTLWINAAPEKIWALVDTFDGKIENWGRTSVVSKLEDKAQNIFSKNYTTNLPNGEVRNASALFRIATRQEYQTIELQREGLADKPKTNELLMMRHDVTAEKGGTRLTTTYHWGARPIIAQLLARADLWSGAYRLKGLAETGQPNERPYYVISAAVALVTGLVTLLGFAAVLNPHFALYLVIALFVHELGHLIAFRMIGQPWGRMVFLPFLGAVAMPRLSFESQAQAVFAALMGPGFSTLLAIICAGFIFFEYSTSSMVLGLGVITVFLNLYNLLPAEPLDGGIALRSVLSRLIGDRARYGLLAMGLLIVGAGVLFGQLIFIIFGGIAVLANLKPRKIDLGLAPLSSLQMCIFAFAYASVCFTHISLLRYFIENISLLQN